jgi:hypothetical protein
MEHMVLVKAKWSGRKVRFGPRNTVKTVLMEKVSW